MGKPERSLIAHEADNNAMSPNPMSSRKPLRFRKTLFFFHIGKTGGTSLIRHFSSVAQRSYIESRLHDVSAIDELVHGDAHEFIAGHFPVATILQDLPSHWTLATVIRDPDWHITSSYWHMRTHLSQDITDDLRELITACQETKLEDLLREPRTELFWTHFDNPQTRALLGKKHGPLDGRDLESALGILASLDFVGTTERLAEFATELAAEFNWAAPLLEREVPRIMVNPRNNTHSSAMPDSTQRAIRENTAFDAELYRAAVTMQAARLKRPVLLRGAVIANNQRSPVLPIADMIRILPVTLENVRLGHELRISGADVLLHPPPAAEGRAVVTIDDIPLDQHVEISGRLVIGHEAAGLVRYSITLAQGEVCHASAVFVVGPLRPLDVRLRFLPACGTSRLVISTEMAAAEATNSYAWASFSAMILS